MKETIFFLILLVTLSCKENNREKITKPDAVTKHWETVRSFSHLDMAKWSRVRISAEPLLDKKLKDVIYILSRNTITRSAYFSSELIPVKYGFEYQVSIMAKKGRNYFFGLRITGIYPDRADAVFDLDKGEVVGSSSAQYFGKPIASIEELSDGWYNCMLSVQVAADEIRLIIGETGAERNVSNWEGKTETIGGVYFLPSSIVLKEFK